MNKKDITPINQKGQAHGYWEWYRTYNGSLLCKRFFNNGKEVGYSEWYRYDNGNELRSKKYHI